MFGLFRKSAKKRFPALSAADQMICDEDEAARAEWHCAYYKRTRATTTVERAHAEAAFQLADERYSAARRAHKAMMDRLTAEARAALTAKAGDAR